MEVVPVLKRAMENPAVLDRLAAMTAMGYTSSGELARFLAVRYANQGVQPNDISRRVELSLRKMGPLLAAPALRQHLQMEAGPVRQRLVLFLAEQQEPLVVEDLIDYLSIPNIEKVAAQRLSEITGVDLRSVNNRSQTMRVWASYNKDKTQAQWYLAALERAQIPTSLAIEQLTPGSGVGPVPELGRLMSVVKEPHLQVLTASLLRQTTGVDFTRGVRFADNSALQAIVDRYKIHVEMIKAAGR